MSLVTLFATIESWPISAAMRGELPGSEWLFPIVETLHVIALTLVVGSIAMIDLRLLGLSSRNTPVSRILDDVLPWTWAAWCAAAVFGALMFLSKAHVYAANLEFRLKFVCMALAALNMLAFRFGPLRQIKHWDSGAPAFGAKVGGGLSLTLWVGVVVFGRWVGFTT